MFGITNKVNDGRNGEGRTTLRKLCGFDGEPAHITELDVRGHNGL